MIRVVIIPLLLLATSWNVQGAIPVDDTMIRTFINDYLDQEEAFTGELVPDRGDLIDRYLGLIPSRFTTFYPAKDKIKVFISIVQDTASLTRSSPCNPVDQTFLDADLDAAIQSGGDVSEKLYVHLYRLDQSGRKFCNFLAHLVCTEEALSPGTHACHCPVPMDWENGKCAFRMGSKCHHVKDIEGRHFTEFDMLREEFMTGAVTARCQEGPGFGLGCSKGRDPIYTCKPDQDVPFLATAKEIAVFLRGIVDRSYSVSNPAAKIQIMRAAMKVITGIGEKDKHRTYSLELHMATRLLTYGSPCDPASSPPLDGLMAAYNPVGNPQWDRFIDKARRALHRELMKETDTGARVCDVFRLLTCPSGSGTCACRPGMVWSRLLRACLIDNGYVCGVSGPQTKLFDLVPTGGGPPEFGYERAQAGCEMNSACESVRNLGSGYCLRPTEQADATRLQADLDGRFTIALGGDCVAQDHVKLFTATDPSSPTPFTDRKAALQAIIATNPSYCKIHQHATCSAAGKCACVPPFPEEGGECKQHIYGVCESTVPGSQKSPLHVQLETLILPLRVSSGSPFASGQDLNCPTFSQCIMEANVWAKLCTCTVPEMFGQTCQVSPNHHIDILDSGDVAGLPTSMQAAAGLSVISELHEAITKIELAMSLLFGAACDPGDHQLLKEVLEFAYDLRHTPQASRAADPRFEKPIFDAQLVKTQALVAKPAAFCKLDDQVICQGGRCGCGPNQFYNAGKCYAELGEACKDDPGVKRADLMTKAPCRPQTRCDGPTATCVSLWVPPPTITSPLNTVDGVRLGMMEYLKREAKKLRDRQNQDEGAPCSLDGEYEVANVLLDIERLTDPPSFPADARQHVRLLEGLTREVDKHTGTFKGTCRPEVPCHPQRRICNEATKFEEEDEEAFASKLESSIVLNWLCLGFSIFGFVLFA